jgi:hypothetical protein
MARIRSIKPEFFLDEELAALSPLHRILFAGLFGQADREGRLEDRPDRIKAQVLPYDRCCVDQMLTKLHSAKFITRYEAGGKRYIEIRTFKKHQHPHVKEPISTIPAPVLPGAKPVQELGEAPVLPGSGPASRAGASGAGAGREGKGAVTDSGGGAPLGPLPPDRQFDPEAIERVFAHYLKTWPPKNRCHLSVLRRDLIAQRLREFTEAELCQAISNSKLDPWDERGDHCSLEMHLFKTYEQTEKWLNFEPDEDRRRTDDEMPDFLGGAPDDDDEEAEDRA